MVSAFPLHVVVNANANAQHFPRIAVRCSSHQRRIRPVVAERRPTIAQPFQGWVLALIRPIALHIMQWNRNGHSSAVVGEFRS